MKVNPRIRTCNINKNLKVKTLSDMQIIDQLSFTIQQNLTPIAVSLQVSAKSSARRIDLRT